MPADTDIGIEEAPTDADIGIEPAPETPTPSNGGATGFFKRVGMALGPTTDKALDLAQAPLSRAVGVKPQDLGRALAGKAIGLPDFLADPALRFAETKSPIVRGYEKGAGNLAESFTSPLSIATVGSGALIAKAPTAIQRLLSLGFAVMGAGQAGSAGGELYEAVKRGDWETAVDKATQLVAGTAQAGMGALGAVHAILPDSLAPVKLAPRAPTPAMNALADRARGNVRPPEIPPDRAAAAKVLPHATAEAAKALSESPQTHLLGRDEAAQQGPAAVQYIMDKFGVSRDEAVQIQSQNRERLGMTKSLPQPPTTEAPNASSQQETAAPNGNVRPQQQPTGQLPAPESSGGIQPQTPERVQTGETPPTGTQSQARPVEVAPLSPDEVRAKYPEAFKAPDTARDIPVEIKQPDGTVIPGMMNGIQRTPDGPKPSVARLVNGGWSHGMLRPGEEIVSQMPTEDQLAAGQAAHQRVNRIQDLSAEPAENFTGKNRSGLAAIEFGKTALTPHEIEALRKAEAAAKAEVDQAKGVAKLIPKKKQQFFTEALRQAEGQTKLETKPAESGTIAQESGTKPAPAETVPAKPKVLRSEQPQDVLDALEATGKINIASVRELRPGYNPPPAARKLFDFQNQSSGIDVVLQGVQKSAAGDFSKLATADDLLDAIDAAGPARQGARQRAAQEARQVQQEIQAVGPVTSLGARLEDWADAKIREAQGRVSAGLDPELLTAYAIKGARIIQSGVADFVHWSREMVKQFGEDIKPHLAAIFERSKAHHASMGDVAYGKAEPAEEPGGKYGMAARVREERAKAGQVVPVEPGKGTTPEEAVEHGRLLLEHGADPEKILGNFEQSGRFSASDIGVVRAQGEKLATDAEVAKAQHGKDSPEYKAAFDALSSWDTRSKAMQTEWHKGGQAQQGETDLETGTFTGLQRAYKDQTGKEFTPQEAEQADEHARKVTQADQDAKVAQDELFKNVPKEPPPKPGAPDDPKSDANVWKKVKDYIEKGEDDYKDIVGKVATDLGMPYEDVAKAIARNKTTKRLADDVWAKQLTARRMKEQARRWLMSRTVPALQRNLQKIPRVMFGLKVGFHGTVALGTHAPMVAFQPPFWKSYFTDFVKMYRMVNPVGNKGQAYYETQVQSLLHRPNFITARRAGLVNDPFTYEDYNSPDMARYIGNVGGMGNRGYFVLKILRQDMFDHHWNQLPDTAKTPEVAKAIADDLNHATGVTATMAPKGANLALFAPRLEASRVAWLATDPARAGATVANWRNASEADKWFAINQAKEKAWVAGTAFGLLALNQGILAATGSKQKVNLSDPMKPDFLKFKAAGQDVAYGGAMISLARLPIRLAALRFKGGSGKMSKLIYPDESMTGEVERYVRSQLAPVAQPLADVAFKGDYENRPLPKMPLSGPPLPMPKRLAARGVKPYTWTELTLDTVLPIPLEEPFKEVWSKGMGMSGEDMKRYGDAFAKSLVQGATGTRLNTDTQAAK